MEVVVHADVDRVEVVALQQLAEVRVDVRDAELLGRGAGRGLVHVGNGDDLHVGRHRRVPRQVLPGDLPGADETDTNPITHGSISPRVQSLSSRGTPRDLGVQVRCYPEIPRSTSG